MINTVSKIHLSKIGGEGGGSTSIWIMSVNILFCFFDGTPYPSNFGVAKIYPLKCHFLNVHFMGFG